MRLQTGLGPHWGSLQGSPGLQTVFQRAARQGRGREKGKGKGRGGNEGKERGGEEEERSIFIFFSTI